METASTIWLSPICGSGPYFISNQTTQGKYNDLTIKVDLFGPENPLMSLKEISNDIISLIIHHILIKVKEINSDILRIIEA